MKRLLALFFILGFGTYLMVNGSSQAATSWPTPSTSPAPFVGVTARPTAVPPLPQISLCLQDFDVTTHAAINPIVCGQNLITAAGNIAASGVSMSSDNIPIGPFPTTVTLVVNGVKFNNVPVNATTGLIGYATLPGIQQLEIIIPPTASYQGTSGYAITR